MIPVKLSMENFISHTNSVLDFTRFAAALIVGVHSGNPDVSNGVGKTAIFDAIRWVLFGKSRFSTKEKVVKRGKSECSVEFIFTIGDDAYKVIRKLDSKANLIDVMFYKFDGQKWKHDGFTGSTNTITNNKIIEVVGLSHDTFVNSVYFKQNDIAGFASAPTAKKKDILKEILQIGIWDSYQKTAKVAEKSLSLQRDTLQSRIDGLGDIESERLDNEAKITIKEKELQNANNILEEVESNIVKCDEEIADLEIVLDKLGITNKKRLESKLTSISNRAREIKDRRALLREEVKKNNETIVTAEGECLVLEGLIGELSNIILSVERPGREEVEKIFMQFSKERRLPSVQYSAEALEKRKFEFNRLQRSIDLLRLQLKQLTTLEPGEECPTCLFEIKDLESVVDRRNVKEKFLERQILEKQEALSVLNDIIKKDSSAFKKADESLLEMDRLGLIIAKHRVASTEANRRNSEIQGELVKLAEEWKTLRTEKDQIVDLLDNVDDVDKGQKELERVYSNKKKLFKNREEARKVIMKISIEQGTLVGFREELERRNAEKDTLIAQKDTVITDLDAYTNLVRAFGKDGIQAIIMENVTEDLREYTNTILKQICNEPMSVDFVTQHQTGSGNWKEGFDIKISIDSSIVDFDDLSGGEQVRVAFALRLALSRLLMRRVGSNIQFLLLDEIDQSLDKYGVEVLAESINALSNEFKILVITHNEFMKERFSHIISVQKEITGSVLRQ